MGGDNALLSYYRKLVYADGRYNDITLSCAYLKSILPLQDFFLKIFDWLFTRFIFCFFLVLFFLFFFGESTY